MKFFEQKYSKTNILYYHGTKVEKRDPSKSRYPWFFLTKNIYYAIEYAKNSHADFKYVDVYILEKELNIFNARSKIDIEILKKNEPKLREQDIEVLKNKDWLTLYGSLDRAKIAKTLEKLGYDGFFNFEETDLYNQTANSIGIFNIDNIHFVKRLTYEDMLKNKKFKDRYDLDISSLSDRVKEFIKDKNIQRDYTLEEWTYLSSDVLSPDAIKELLPQIEELYKKYKDKREELLNEELLYNQRTYKERPPFILKTFKDILEKYE
jgi:hypothetical protein